MTKQQISKFIKLRNTADFHTNLQFQLDLETVGLKVADLGPVRKTEDHAFEWDTQFGTLREWCGQMTLLPK